MTPNHSDSGIGSSVSRKEDRKVLLGGSKGVDDIPLSDALHIQFIRSEKAHATFTVDATDARDVSGVVAVYTPDDIKQSETTTPNPFTLFSAPMEGVPYPDDSLRQRSFAEDKVHYHGEIIGMVVAETQRIARDALDEITIEYDIIGPVVTPQEATADDAAAIHESVPDNVAFEGGQGDRDLTDEQFENAAYTVELEKDAQRVSPTPLEPRAAIGQYDEATEHLDIIATTQIPHAYRRLLAQMLEYPENKIDVTVPDMGGGFGARQHPYPADVLVGWCAVDLERTVKWRSTRTENQLVENDGRGYEGTWEIALSEQGDILAVRADIRYDLGAWIARGAASLAEAGNLLMTGLYDIPAAYSHVTGIVTNTARIDAYRGVSATPMLMMLERLVSKVAKKAGMDPAAVRKRNFVDPDQFPYQTAGGAKYDSGDYERNFDIGLDELDYSSLRERQEQLREEGRYIGIGISCWTEVAGLGPCGHIDVATWGYGGVQVHPTGEVTVYAGSSNHGQGHETSLGQVASHELGVPLDSVTVVENSTKEVTEGVGTYASRTAALTGGAVAKSCRKIVRKGGKVAAHETGVTPDVIEFDDGTYYPIDSPEDAVTFSEVARQVHMGADIPEEMEPGLEEQTYYDPENCTWPFGTHMVVVEVDPDTGEYDIDQYVVTEDCGVQINPAIVEGQIVGGIAQGLGQALYEEVEYADDGTHLSAPLRDETLGSSGGYTVPKAEHMPDITIKSTTTPSPHTPHGAKGMGESGTVAAPGAIVNAIEDAIEPFDIDPMTPPITPEKVWMAINREGKE